MAHEFCAEVATELGILVVSVDYRLAPEHPFPIPLEDTYTGLRWLLDHADELGVDRRRIAIGGPSAGGGLAACLAQLAFDRGEVPLVFQLLVYPMLDDRSVLRDDQAGTGDFMWDPESNRFGWTCYLGHPPWADAAPDYAAAARREHLFGLPSTWIGVGSLDLFHAEDVEYAARLRSAGVDVELVVVPGMYHGADTLPRVVDAPSMVAFNQSKLNALKSAIGQGGSRETSMD
jgi:acetyl esterase/lipase